MIMPSIRLWASIIACTLRLVAIVPNIEGIFVTELPGITRSSLRTRAATLAATNFKSNYEVTSALKGLRPSSSNYYNQQKQQQQNDDEEEEEVVYLNNNNYNYIESEQLKGNIVNELPLTREAESGFAATTNGFVPTAIMAAGHQTVNSYNSNNDKVQNIYDNNYNYNNKYNQHENDIVVDFNVDVDGNMEKYMKIPIKNRNYVPITKTTVNNGELQYRQERLYADNNYNNNRQIEHVEINTPMSYLLDYENVQFNDYQLQQPQQQEYNDDAKFFTTTSEHVPKGIYNTHITNYATLKQQQQPIEHVKHTTTMNMNLDSNRHSKYYEHLHQSEEQQLQKQHLPSIRNIIKHNPLSEAALADIPLERHVAVTKQVPVVVQHQRILQPYNQSLPIEVPQTVINTQTRPLPIQVPVSKTIAVPEMRDLRIPIERLHPVPVERRTPYIVERHIPYNVERQVAIPYYYPYPIRVPIIKTVVHKSPAHRRARATEHGGKWVLKRTQRQHARVFG